MKLLSSLSSSCSSSFVVVVWWWWVLLLSSLSSNRMILLVNADMDCDYNNAASLDVGEFKILIADMATTNAGFTMPQQMNFQIYTMPGGTEPRWQSSPDNNYIQPRRNGDILRFYYINSAPVGAGQSINAGVAVWVPYDWLTTITTSSNRGDTIKLQNTGTDAQPQLSLNDNGSGNSWRISSDSSPIIFTALGQNTNVDSKVQSGSTYFFTSNNSVRINLIYGNSLEVTLLGDNNNLFLEGRYSLITMVGSNNQVNINDACSNCQGCNQVSGGAENGNTCNTDTTDFGEVQVPACAVPTTAATGVDISVGAVEGASSSSSSAVAVRSFTMTSTTTMAVTMAATAATILIGVWSTVA